jgi:hypothetical protein
MCGLGWSGVQASIVQPWSHLPGLQLKQFHMKKQTFVFDCLGFMFKPLPQVAQIMVF